MWYNVLLVTGEEAVITTVCPLKFKAEPKGLIPVGKLLNCAK
ncbi:hypothetical protein FLBR109950_15880 [Flavobacterium branchiophilum]